jgi:MFS family permease
LEPIVRRLLVSYLMGTFFFWFSLYIYVPILPPYLKELGCPLSMIGIVLGSYGVSQFFLRIPLGFWADRKRILKPLVLIGVSCSGLSCLIFALFPSAWSFLGARTLSGVAASFWVVYTVLFASYFPEGRSSKAMGQLVFCMSWAQLTCTLLGGWLAEHYGYGAPFWAGVIAALVSLLSFVWVEEKQTEGRPSGLTLKEGLQVFASPGLVMISLLAAVLMFNSFTTVHGFVPLLAVQLGANRTQLGILVALTLAAHSAGSILVGTKLLNWLPARSAVMTAFLFMSLASLTLPLVPNVYVLYVNQIVSGLGRGLGYSVLLGLVFPTVSTGERATAMGVFQSLYSLGMFSGPLFGGWVGGVWGISGIFIICGVFTLLVIPLLRIVKIGRDKTCPPV